jgi:hypothetical protein
MKIDEHRLHSNKHKDYTNRPKGNDYWHIEDRPDHEGDYLLFNRIVGRRLTFYRKVYSLQRARRHAKQST